MLPGFALAIHTMTPYIHPTQPHTPFPPPPAAQGLYAEKWAPFVKELAVMVAREGSGRVVAFPLVETVHADSICLVTECPAAVPRAVADK